MTAPVAVPRSTLTGIRWSVAVIVLGISLLAAGLVIRLFSDQERCEAGNQFRRHDLPMAFEVHDQHLARAFGATDEQLASFEAEFQGDLDALFPERDCPLF